MTALPADLSGDAAALLAAAATPQARARPREGAECARRAAELAVARGDHALAAQAESLQALHLVRLGELESSIDVAHRALAHHALAGPSVAQSLLHSTLSLAYERAGLYSLAVPHAAAALGMARDQGDLAAECWALIRMGTAADESSGQHGLELLTQAVVLAREVPGQEPELLFSALNNCSRRHMVEADRRADPASARAALEAALPLAEEAARLAQPGFTSATAEANLGGLHRRLGHLSRARDHFARALAEARQGSYAGLASTVELALASLAFQLEPTAANQATLTGLLDGHAAGADPDLRLQARQHLVDGCRARGDLAAALSHLERLHADWRAAQARRSDLQSRLLFNQAELDQARHAAERARLATEVQRLRAEAERQTAERLSLHRDVLEREVAARTAELAQATAVAQAASRAKSTFLSIVSHELRTPLNGITGMVEVALLRATDERQRRQLQTACAAARRLGDLIGNILDYVDADSGRPHAPADVDLRALLQAAVRSRTEQAQARGLVITVDCDRALPAQVRMDGQRVDQIVSALLDNSLKFSSPGPVQLAARWMGDAGTAGELHLSVSDTGPGLLPDVLRRLFTPFEPGDGSLTRAHGGLGMGLALAQRLAHSLGGEIGVDANPPAGTRFWVRLPLPAAADSTTGAAPGA